jgi:hypothetical protein
MHIRKSKGTGAPIPGWTTTFNKLQIRFEGNESPFWFVVSLALSIPAS